MLSIDDQVRSLLSADYLDKKLFPSGSWALDPQKHLRSIVGENNRILWARGETCLLCADTGSGKSTLTLNIAASLIGIYPKLLGMEVDKNLKSGLYISADRPTQLKTRLSTIVDKEDKQIWDDRMYIHEGQLPFSLNRDPGYLYPFVKQLAEMLDRPYFDFVFIDSLKDVVDSLDDNVDGIHINRALQSLSNHDIEVLLNVHPRKQYTDRGKGDPTSDDIGGNKNIVNGVGSALFVMAPDDLGSQRIIHLKSPAEKITDLYMSIDYSTGIVSSCS